MKTPSTPWTSRARAALALALAASPAGAQTQSADAAAATSGISAPTVSVSPASGVGVGATLAPAMTPALSGGGAILSAPGAATRSVSASAAAASVPASAAAPRAVVPGSVAPGAKAATASAVDSAPLRAAPSSLVDGSVSPASTRAPGREASGPAAAPTANAALTGAAGRVNAAAGVQAAVGDEASVRAALGRVFDAESLTGATPNGPNGATPGSPLTARDKITQVVSIANTASPADAPGLYLDAIKTAQDSLPAVAAAAVARVVRGFAARKADASLDNLAAAAYQAALTGSEKETNRTLAAFDKWESVLGAPDRPFVSNAESLKSDVRGFLSPVNSAGGAARSAPHVWFQRRGASYTAVLPSASRVPRLSAALAAGFALKTDALAPLSPLADAYRAFASAPGASSGAGVVYRARRALGGSVPAAALSAARYWFSVLLESLWRRLASLFSSAPSYDLSARSGQDALRRAATSGRAARDEASSALRRLSGERRTVGDARAAFDAAVRSASAFDALTGESVSRSVAALRGLFDAAAAGQDGGAALGARGAEFVDGPGGLESWLSLIVDHSRRRAETDLLSVPAGASVVNLGAERGTAVGAAALARELGADAAFVAFDDQLWARGRGPAGEVRVSADLRASEEGGAVSLTAARCDAALARRLSDLGFAVTVDGAGLRAELGGGGFGRDASELGFLAARALAASLGRAPAADPALSAVSAAVRRDRRAASDLAERLDGRAPFAGARVIGYVGPDEALAPVAATLGGRPVLVSALRDPGTGLLEFAVPLAANGAPLGGAEIRTLLRAR